MEKSSVSRITAILLLATLGTARGPAQETRSPLPYMVAPSNTATSPPSSEAPIVERLPRHLQSGPPRIACWAIPSNSKAYAGYYVGGGSAFCCGQPRLETEGTWGWDYRGCWLPHRVFLQWWHGRHYQGGAGAYRVDGPRLLNALREHRTEGQGPP
jgi:hypothetical protein